MMKLYWSPGTRSLRTLWMLEEAGVPYERVLVDIRNGGRIDPRDQKERPGPQGCDMDPFNKSGCTSQEYWNRLKTEQLGDTGKKARELRAGVEPPREYLTQPPRGYLAPKSDVKNTTFEPLHREEEDIRDFFRKKSNPDE